MTSCRTLIFFFCFCTCQAKLSLRWQPFSRPPVSGSPRRAPSSRRSKLSAASTSTYRTKPPKYSLPFSRYDEPGSFPTFFLSRKRALIGRTHSLLSFAKDFAVRRRFLFSCCSLQKLREHLTFESEHFRTAVVSLGHIALSMPDKFMINIKNIVSRKASGCVLVEGGRVGPQRWRVGHL